ncbi:MAG: GAF domain-containing sensor histidine kinase [Candidatus Omnitrophota bacterium]|nr:GAF domain-containing sensor histidine kinase [Candidatus Omnitrophota bacterium]
MALTMKLTVIASFLLGLVIAFSGSEILRLAYGLFMLLVGSFLISTHEILRRQMVNYQKDLDRINRICDELDQNTKIIVQTDLELTRTQEALDKKLSGLYVLHEMSKKILSVRSVADLSHLVTETVVTSFGYERCLLCILDPDEKSKPRVAAQAGFEPEEDLQAQVPQLIEWVRFPVLARGESLFAADVDPRGPVPQGISPEQAGSEAPQIIGAMTGLRSYAAVPLLLEGRPQGFLLAGTNPPYPKLDSGDVELLSILASEVGVAIENLQLYEALKISYDELEERVKLRTSQLAKANEELVRLNRLKSDFVSAVSHELRTPLTSIKGYTSLMRAGKLGAVNKEQGERLEKINRHTDFLTNLISELLDIARIESGRVNMTIRPVELPRLLEGVVDLLGPQLKEKNLNVDLKTPAKLPTIEADENQIQRVFTNLLSNAIRFTPEKGTISIRAVPTDATLNVEVSDTGIGMPPEDVSMLFTEFFRADNPVNRERKGTGLGLVLVKRIIEAHGGRIGVRSEVGQGTTFFFNLPWKHNA